MKHRGAILFALGGVALAVLVWGWLRPAPPSDFPVAEEPAVGHKTQSDVDAQTAAVEATVPSVPRVTRATTSSGILLRLQRNPRIDGPEPPYGPIYEASKHRIEQAPPLEQYQFGLLLYQCREVPADDAELARQVEQVHQTRRLNGWDVSDPVQEEQTLRREYADCAGIPQNARLQHRDWMKRAADGGLIEAQLNLMYYLPKAEYCQFIEDCSADQAAFMARLREESRASVTRALEAGSVEALRTVGSWALNEEMGPPDTAEAYAYLSAYDQVQHAAGRERELARMLEQLRARLRPVDLEAAEAKVRDLLSNPKCCVLTR
ncbi:MAG: hypothetical protein ACT4QA_11150 [Panacagrimonas sp.]